MAELTVAGLIDAYLEFAREYYRKHGRQTEEFAHIRSATQPARERYGDECAALFGPKKLKAIRQGWIDRGLIRTQINKRVGRIRRAFAWGVEEELIPPETLVALRAVRGLRTGRSNAAEPKVVRPVADDLVDAVRPFVSRQVWAMIEIQRHTGMRPGEVVILRTADLDMTGTIWEYRPHQHKMEHTGKDRRIQIGPRGRLVLQEWLKPDRPKAYLFSPRDAAQERARRLRADRRTRVQPSQQHRRKTSPQRSPSERYSRASYARAIGRACRRAGVPHWAPNQLRHAVGTRVRRELGLEASQCVLGHARANVTEIYAERDAALARTAMERLG